MPTDEDEEWPPDMTTEKAEYAVFMTWDGPFRHRWIRGNSGATIRDFFTLYAIPTK